MNERPVPIRTSRSAEDFWCRERESAEVSPTGKVVWTGGERNTERRQRLLAVPNLNRWELPFGRQAAASPMQSWQPRQEVRLEGSRFVERKALQCALADADAELKTRPRATNEALLAAEVARLERGLCLALKVNKALAAAMLQQQQQQQQQRVERAKPT